MLKPVWLIHHHLSAARYCWRPGASRSARPGRFGLWFAVFTVFLVAVAVQSVAGALHTQARPVPLARQLGRNKGGCKRGSASPCWARPREHRHRPPSVPTAAPPAADLGGSRVRDPCQHWGRLHSDAKVTSSRGHCSVRKGVCSRPPGWAARCRDGCAVQRRTRGV